MWSEARGAASDISLNRLCVHIQAKPVVVIQLRDAMRRQSCSGARKPDEAFHRTAICERHFVCPRSDLAAAQTTALKKAAPSTPLGTRVSPTSPGMADREPKLETQHHDAVMPSGGHAFLKRANSLLWSFQILRISHPFLAEQKRSMSTMIQNPLVGVRVRSALGQSQVTTHFWKIN